MNEFITCGEIPQTIIKRCVIFSSKVRLLKKIKIPLKLLSLLSSLLTKGTNLILNTMNAKKYKFEVIHNNNVIGVIEVYGFEDNARFLAYRKLHTITNINHCLIDLKAT